MLSGPLQFMGPGRSSRHKAEAKLEVTEDMGLNICSPVESSGVTTACLRFEMFSMTRVTVEQLYEGWMCGAKDQSA